MRHVSMEFDSCHFSLFAGSPLTSGSQGTRQGTKLFSKHAGLLSPTLLKALNTFIPCIKTVTQPPFIFNCKIIHHGRTGNPYFIDTLVFFKVIKSILLNFDYLRKVQKVTCYFVFKQFGKAQMMTPSFCEPPSVRGSVSPYLWILFFEGRNSKLFAKHLPIR